MKKIRKKIIGLGFKVSAISAVLVVLADLYVMIMAIKQAELYPGGANTSVILAGIMSFSGVAILAFIFLYILALLNGIYDRLVPKDEIG